MILHNGNPVYNRLKLFGLSLFFGIMGLDRIYLRDYKYGMLKFITLGGLGIWYFLDLFNIGIGNKLGSQPYAYSCELSKKYNCNHETNLILKYLMFFAFASIVIIYYYHHNKELILVRNDPYEPNKYNK